MKRAMTISTAIEKIDGLAESMRNKGYEDLVEALEMASEALEHQIGMGNMIFEFEEDPEGTLYNKAAVMESLNDHYMLSAVNRGGVG